MLIGEGWARILAHVEADVAMLGEARRRDFDQPSEPGLGAMVTLLRLYHQSTQNMHNTIQCELHI